MPSEVSDTYGPYISYSHGVRLMTLLWLYHEVGKFAKSMQARHSLRHSDPLARPDL